jgi:cobalt/nickel transport system permease protein
VIQAVFFGDGGITAIGANCFNMAVIGSFTAYACYRMIAGRTPIDSPRRVVAAALAGYISINLSALAAALELGLQPFLYRDASGASLYAPYPWRIAIPAMMIGHLTVAGVAEMVISAGVVGYLQRAEPGLLKLTAPGASVNDAVSMGWMATRPLWIALGALMILTPLGILAAGSAWGEWSVEDFSNVEARQRIEAVSSHQPAPPEAPSGMRRLASFWTAPMPRYAPPFLKSASFGYLLSSLAGTGLIILGVVFMGWILRGRAG